MTLPGSDTSPADIQQSRRSVTSPAVRRLLAEHDLSLDDIEGTGDRGRVRHEDVLRHAAERRPDPPGDRVVPFTPIRRRTAERMLRSTLNAAQVMTAMEIDYEPVARVRDAVAARFKAEEGFSLTYLPFVVAATARVLREFPELNASVLEDALEIRGRIDIGVAVALGYEGLVVPSISSADDLDVVAVARAIHDVSTRARDKKLRPNELSGGTFTVTNPGGHGTFVGAAIINPPQVGILNVDGISKQPVVVERPGEPDSIQIRRVGHVALSWDHRAIDGLYAGAFLKALRQLLESHDWSSELGPA